MNKRVILRYRGAEAMPEEDVRTVCAMPSARLLERTSRMLLIELPAEDAQTLAAQFPHWTVSEERTLELPEPTPDLRVRRPAASRKPKK